MRTEFEVHMLNGAGKANARSIARSFDRLLEDLEALCPNGREFSIVKTKLEEACFFAKKAMAVNPAFQELSAQAEIPFPTPIGRADHPV